MGNHYSLKSVSENTREIIFLFKISKGKGKGKSFLCKISKRNRQGKSLMSKSVIVKDKEKTLRSNISKGQ